MTTLHHWLVVSHIVFGSIALSLFWIPALARKGSKLHVFVGRYYAWAMYAVVVSAFVASVLVLADPLGIRHPDRVFAPERAAELADRYRMFAWFLLMLSVLVFASVRHGLEALREKREPGRLKHPFHRFTILLLASLGIFVGFYGLANSQWLLLIFGLVSINGAFSLFRDSVIEKPTRNDLVKAHLNGLIGSGIGAHTAFFAFGGSRFLGEVLPGQWQLIPWVLPTVVGIIAIRRLERQWSAKRRATSGGQPAEARAQLPG